MIKEWIFKQLIKWFASSLTLEKMQEWIAAAKAYALPKLREWSSELVAKLRAEAQKTENVLDDAAVDALEKFFEALLPDNPTMI